MKLHIEFELPKWSKKIIAVGAPVVVLGALATIAVAAPTQFEAGNTLRAADLQSLNVVKSADGGVQYSVGATKYCNQTINTPGDMSSLTAPTGLTGYARAKFACQALTGCSATAHMCTSDEIIRTLALSTPIPNIVSPNGAWFATAVWARDPGTNNVTNDCSGYTNNTGAVSGSMLQSTVAPSLGPFAAYAVCTTQQPVLCCD